MLTLAIAGAATALLVVALLRRRTRAPTAATTEEAAPVPAELAAPAQPAAAPIIAEAAHAAEPPAPAPAPATEAPAPAAPAAPVVRTCLGCGVKGVGLLRCSRCRKVYFCNRACQIEAVKSGHRNCTKAVTPAAVAALSTSLGVDVAFEAAVAGGIPILKSLGEGLAAKRLG